MPHCETARILANSATRNFKDPSGTQFGADKAVDDDPETRWAISDNVKQAWLEVELAQPSTISRLVIKELDPRLAQFQLQYRMTANEEWKVAYSNGDRNKFPMFETPRRACSVEAVILH